MAHSRTGGVYLYIGYNPSSMGTGQLRTLRAILRWTSSAQAAGELGCGDVLSFASVPLCTD